MWPGLIQKSKEGGLDVIETYVFWNLHEPVKNQVVFFIFTRILENEFNSFTFFGGEFFLMLKCL